MNNMNTVLIISKILKFGVPKFLNLKLTLKLIYGNTRLTSR